MKHRIVSAEQGERALEAIRHLESELLALQRRVAHTRKYLPWVKVENLYLFESDQGTRSLADLFAGKSQLITFHFKCQPFDMQGGLMSSFEADNFADILVHLNHHDIAFMLVSDASLHRINEYKQRMAWQFEWVSTDGGSFNKDYLASSDDKQENYGMSVFCKDSDGFVYHTYSCSGEAMEMFNTALHLMDLTPEGRGDLPESEWAKRHDDYEEGEPQQNQQGFKLS
jgi:predicted dithiol-disulfide oxidoreductase (DUF899 family)